MTPQGRRRQANKDFLVEGALLCAVLAAAGGMAGTSLPFRFWGPAILVFVLMPFPAMDPAAYGWSLVRKRAASWCAMWGALGALSYVTTSNPARLWWVGAPWMALSTLYYVRLRGGAVSRLLKIETAPAGKGGADGSTSGLGWRFLFREGARRLYQLRCDVALGDGVVLSLVAWLGWSFYPQAWPDPFGLPLLVACWVLAQLALKTPLLPLGLRLFGSLFVSVVVLGLGGLGWLAIRGQSLGAGHVVVLVYAAVAVLVYRCLEDRMRVRWPTPMAENLRWLGLLLVWAWSLRGFFSVVLHGAGDALWYGMMLADMLEQVRAGVFPVFVGQTEYQFNGAIYPVRVAPAFHYLGALTDALTFGTLNLFGVQNALIAGQGLAALLMCYVAAGRMAGSSRWIAWVAAVLFLTCPGTLGIAYNSDLYMSWMTVPFIPIAIYSLVRWLEGEPKAAIALGASLGWMWWGHSPIALWMTLFAGTGAVVGVIVRRACNTRELMGVFGGAGMFAAIAAYPVASVLCFPPESGMKTAAFQEAIARTFMPILREVFPRTLLPVSPVGRSLSDFQLGYSLWLVLLLAAAVALLKGKLALRVLTVFAVFLAVLLLPIPGVTLFLWETIPDFVRNTTGNWVMNRLYLVQAGLLVFAGVMALRAVAPAGASRRLRGAVQAICLAACLYSLWQAGHFVTGSLVGRRPFESADVQSRKENAMVTRFAYLVFPRLPDYFSHGVVDPVLENRLWDVAAKNVIVSNAQAVFAGAADQIVTGAFEIDPQNPRGGLRWNRTIKLEPDKRYVCRFEFLRDDVAGVIRFDGGVWREYAIPEYGSTQSFGLGGRHSPFVGLWTTRERAAEASVSFIVSQPSDRLHEILPFGNVAVAEYDPARLPVHVKSWIPYKAIVRAPGDALLETPRMYQQSYRAWVNGRRVDSQKSPEGLVMLPVPSGESEVKVIYVPPVGLLILFWLSAAAGVCWVSRGVVLRWKSAWLEQGCRGA
jgi:hypothetical protein